MHYHLLVLKCIQLFPFHSNVEPQEKWPLGAWGSRLTFHLAYYSFPSCGTCLRSSIINHHTSQLATALSLGLATVREGVSIRFARQVRITLCDTFLKSKKHSARWHSFPNVWSLRRKVFGHTTRTQMRKSPKKDAQTSMTNSGMCLHQDNVRLNTAHVTNNLIN